MLAMFQGRSDPQRNLTSGKRGRRALLGLAMALSASALADIEPAQLESDFQQLSSEVHRKLARDLDSCPSGLNELLASSDSLQPRLQTGCLLLHLQQSDAADSINDPAQLAQLLLSRHLHQPLKDLAERESVQRQQRLVTQLQFSLARHRFETGDAQEADALMQALSNRYALTEDQRQYLHLTRGLKHQQVGEHRAAIKLYEDFEPGHAYHAQARTNLAIAYLKQGWWTDAHQEIESLLSGYEKDPQSLPDDEFANRLRVLLGLSQLQQGFYRYASDSFRSIQKNSRYVAHAWRGLGLTALYQEDYPRALNAFLHLKEHNHPALPEGPFLVGFTYDQMHSLALAQASYTEAVIDYQTRIADIDQRLAQLDTASWRPEQPPSEQREPMALTFSQNNAENNQWQQYRELQALQAALPDQGFERERDAIRQLRHEYRRLMADNYRAQLEQRKAHLQSYLSQSQFGLATVYDRQ